jgi:hypothetical protein
MVEQSTTVPKVQIPPPLFQIHRYLQSSELITSLGYHVAPAQYQLQSAGMNLPECPGPGAVAGSVNIPFMGKSQR